MRACRRHGTGPNEMTWRVLTPRDRTEYWGEEQQMSKADGYLYCLKIVVEDSAARISQLVGDVLL